MVGPPDTDGFHSLAIFSLKSHLLAIQSYLRVVQQPLVRHITQRLATRQ
ncbi:hypothetical protein MESS2_830008 [Mesorhizobium metallidurans STM 2683]|uniref:Uncharacterized protein n=1 Tax=Mesorhizobium metallidurans STM 2683 TaxID=1297569 RepID=M5EYQ1_9HYPH|nr:hypothetical protein MESS2_830008 [Mesorhizobium metallidurans STM 2683]